MADDDQMTPEEERATAALLRTLRQTSSQEPLRLDVQSWIAAAQAPASFSVRTRAGFALAVVAVLVVAVAVVLVPQSNGPAATPTSALRVQHFDNGQFRFDYPTEWRDLSDGPDQIVFGTGTYCSGMPSSGCNEATSGIGGGKVVLRVWTANSGAPGYCASDATGPVSRKFIEGPLHASQPTRRWEIRRPGFVFGAGGNAWIEAVTENPAEVAAAQALVDSFAWDVDYCTSPSDPPTLPGTVGLFDNGTFSFDYPTSWQELSPGFFDGFQHTEAVIGTGTWHTGCYNGDNEYGCKGDSVDVSSGRVVAKVFERGGGPPNSCDFAEPTPNVTLGANRVLLTQGEDGSTTWEIRPPGARFGWQGNVQIMAWTDGADARAQVEALVASFRWDKPSEPAYDQCASQAPAGTTTPS